MPRVLIVDDDKAQILLIQDALGGENLEIVAAVDARETFEAIYRQIPDLIILDIGLPGEDGFDILRSIRVEPRYDGVPIVIYSGSHDIESKTRALDLGAVEYLEKPLHARELAAHVRAILRFKLKQDQIFEEYKRLSELSLIDPLTGAYNRRALDTFLKSRLSESSRHGIPVSCVMFDIDHFKDVNDSHGHHVGDVVLKDISDLVRGVCRQEDALIRYGGEEYLVILFHTPRDGAEIFGERVRERVAEHEFKAGDVEIEITMSGGIASQPEDDVSSGDHEAMIKLADKRLYAAKRAGRNQIISSD
jgi:two-component system cell cycle response regulator